MRLKLLDFKKTVYPGSDIPKSFSSRVEIEDGGLRREALIAMNRPLRFHGYTFYQSAYGEDDRRRAQFDLCGGEKRRALAAVYIQRVDLPWPALAFYRTAGGGL